MILFEQGSGFNVFGFYAALNALIALVLGILVVRARLRTQTPIGDGGNPEMAGPLRAHANNSEYVPIALILMLAMNSLGASIWMIHAAGVSLTLGRVMHAIGLSKSVGPSTMRFVGMVLTWLAYVIGIAMTFLLAFLPAAMAS